jgi:hypothetical protein
LGDRALECIVLGVPLVRQMRKVVLLVLAVVIVGAVPATAIIGFCAKMPCCFAKHGEGHGASIGVERQDCCDTVSCAETQPQKLGLSPDLKEPGMAAVDLPLAVTVVPVSPLLAAGRHAGIEPAPHPVRQRLSALSLLLI